MPSARVPALTGGCQCGSVRYALYAVPERASICHCRMCQKQFGGYFGPLASAPPEDFAWTRGAPAWFRSSEAARRGFCAACGTPLAYQVIGEEVEIALGSLDDPARVPPTRQVGLEGRLSLFAELAALPEQDASETRRPRTWPASPRASIPTTTRRAGRRRADLRRDPHGARRGPALPRLPTRSVCGTPLRVSS